MGISSYKPVRTREAARILRALGTPCLIHQPSYNMFNRWIEQELLDVLAEEGMGCIVFTPLAQMAVAWNLRHPGVTSVLVGASRVSQIKDSAGAVANLEFSAEELEEIERVLAA